MTKKRLFSLAVFASLLLCSGGRLSAASGQANSAPNAAGLEIKVEPADEIPTGAQIQFKVSARKRGYVILVNIDAEGQAKQIFPALAGDEMPFGATDDLNMVKPEKPLVVPDARNALANFEFYASQPGQGTIVGLMSSVPVEIVDLPELPASGDDREASVKRIFEAIGGLQVLPRDENPRARASQAETPNWSMVAVDYRVK